MKPSRRPRCLPALLGLVLTAVARAAPWTPPDWSGWWAYAQPLTDDLRRTPPPLEPAAARAWADGQDRDAAPDPMRYCRPPQFTGYSGGFVGAIELLFTPGRVTVLGENGLVRRIYLVTDLDTGPQPHDPPPTGTGFSVGRWDADTLVVETTRIEPTALWPQAGQGALPIGDGARVVERIRRIGPDTLRFEIVTEAPELFAAPDRRVREYRRMPGKTVAQEYSPCAAEDRAIDPRTGAQRFDLTPPADLPPPP